ncbi:MAG: aminotransferase class I/II-fold pyridoxal phosphate-dependent enzyme [Chloroflexota bacterium]|jgi:glutamate/tyrosine decarboxylase-like PLP-dependent enzyme
MRAQIEKLARQASPLEPDSQERERLLAAVAHYAHEFLNQIPDQPAFDEKDTGSGLLEAKISETGIGIEAALELLHQHVDTTGQNPVSPRFLGFIPGGGLYQAALGDFLAAVTNRYSGNFFANPGAVRLENMLLAWLADIAGFPNTAAGNLTSGGSLAHLTGIVTARDAGQISAGRIQSAVVYLTSQTHHSVAKALRIAGLEGCIIRNIPVDNRWRMDVDALSQAITADKKAGLHPWLVVPSAGTTNTGSVDPLPAVADIANEHDLWLHLDGAYGAFFALCEQGRAKLAGMERADSIVMDPHKTLFLPYGSGAILVKDAQKLYASFHAHADYMGDWTESIDELSPCDLSPELSRHFRGLRLWLPLMLVGVAPFRAALAEKLLLARYFYEEIQAADGFRVGPEPDLAIATFWYEPRRGDTNAFNQRLAQELQGDGRVFLSTTWLGDRFVLRLAVGVFRTHLEAIDETLAIVKGTARELVIA